MILPDSFVQPVTNKVLHSNTSSRLDTTAWRCPIGEFSVTRLYMSYDVLQVYHVRNKMDKVGLDMLLDIHGDEELPYNFINGNEVRQASCCSDQSNIGLMLGCQVPSSYAPRSVCTGSFCWKLWSCLLQCDLSYKCCVRVVWTPDHWWCSSCEQLLQ